MRNSNRIGNLAQLAALAVLLSLGGALMGPRLARASRQNNDAVLCEALRYLRAEIQVYRAEHRNVAPGYAALDEQTTPDSEMLASLSDAVATPAPAVDSNLFVRQLTEFTDEQGHVQPMRTQSCDHGPYLVAIPQNPITAKSGVLVIDCNVMAKPDESKPYGWIYNARTGQVIANVRGIDAAGVAYASY